MEFNKKITGYGDVIDTITLDLNRMKLRLKDFLERSDIDINDKSFEDLLISVENLKVMLKDKEYVGLVFDKNGYIVRQYDINDFYEDNLPDDVEKGYYKIIKGKLHLDYERKRQLEER